MIVAGVRPSARAKFGTVVTRAKEAEVTNKQADAFLADMISRSESLPITIETSGLLIDPPKVFGFVSLSDGLFRKAKQTAVEGSLLLCRCPLLAGFARSGNSVAHASPYFFRALPAMSFR